MSEVSSHSTPLLKYESDIVRRDGSTLHLRPIVPDDAPKLLELYDHLSPESLYYRFFTIPTVDPAKAERLARKDFHNESALVGESGPHIVAA